VIKQLGRGYDPSIFTTVEANAMIRDFPKIQCGLVVATGGLAPNEQDGIRLGDVVVGSSYKEGEGIGYTAHYYKDGDEVSQKIRWPKHPYMQRLLHEAGGQLKAKYEKEGNPLNSFIEKALDRNPGLRKSLGRPDASTERPHPSNVMHNGDKDEGTKQSCGRDAFVQGEKHVDPTIHHGRICRAYDWNDRAIVRDGFPENSQVLCFGPFVSSVLECKGTDWLAIRGISGYLGSDGSEEWQGYAAMTAAMYAKDLLCSITPERMKYGKGRRMNEEKNEKAPLGESLAAQEEVVPEKVVPEKVVPEKVVPEKVVPEKVVPEKVMPEKVVLEKVMPEKTQQEENKQEETHQDEIQQEEIQQEEIQQEEIQQEEIQQEEIQKEDTQQEETQLEEIQQEWVTPEEIEEGEIEDEWMQVDWVE
jgi:hypothetical protein